MSLENWSVASWYFKLKIHILRDYRAQHPRHSSSEKFFSLNMFDDCCTVIFMLVPSCVSLLLFSFELPSYKSQLHLPAKIWVWEWFNPLAMRQTFKIHIHLWWSVKMAYVSTNYFRLKPFLSCTKHSIFLFFCLNQRVLENYQNCID